MDTGKGAGTCKDSLIANKSSKFTQGTMWTMMPWMRRRTTLQDQFHAVVCIMILCGKIVTGRAVVKRVVCGHWGDTKNLSL